MWELGTALGLDQETTSRVADYLKGEYLLEFQTTGGGIGITHNGIVEMELAISNPKTPTTHFPAVVNIVQVTGNVIDSQIQQAAEGSQQIHVTQDLQRALSDLLSELDKSMSELKIEEEKQGILSADLDTIRAQLRSSEPKRSIIREALSSMRTILEGAGAVLLAGKVAELLLMLP